MKAGEVGHGVFGWPEVDHVPARQDHELVDVVEDCRAGLRMQTKQNKTKNTCQLKGPALALLLQRWMK